MEGNNKNIHKIIHSFQTQKHRFPKEIAWKLQYMLDLIHGQPQPINELTEAQANEIKDLEDLTPQALKLIFLSIVTSILSPDLYCSFEKGCKIKMEGPREKWIKVYASFSPTEVCFTNRKKVLKFAVDGLTCVKFSEIELHFKYKGVRKLKVRFDHLDAARNMDAKISQMIEELKGRQNEEYFILNSQAFEEDLKVNYTIYCQNHQNVFLVHKKEPKIHVTMFLKQELWDIFSLGEYVVNHKFWNSRVRDQKFLCCDNDRVFIERRLKPSSLLSSERRTFTELKVKQIRDNYYLFEEENAKGVPTSKSIILSEIHIKFYLEILTPTIVKLILDCTFNGKGHCNTSDSRNMLIDYFSDIMFLQDQYSKHNKKGKLSFKLPIRETFVTEPKGFIEEVFENIHRPIDAYNEETDDEVFYSIRANKLYLNADEDEIDAENVKDEFYELDDHIDSDFESSTSHSSEVHGNMMKMEEVCQNDEELYESCLHKDLDAYEKTKPKCYDDKISLEYVKLIKNQFNEKSYLHQHFNSKESKSFPSETPWYDPSVIIPTGKEYKANESNELIFINDEVIQGQKDSLIFVIKQVGANLLSGKSVLNVSLPVDIFEPRSLLERSAASFSTAPKYFKEVGEADVKIQMEAVIGFVSSVNPLELVMLKPFNPILGETFQAKIGGIPIYYEQISHHPPISSYFMKSSEFTIYGNLIAIANVSLNSGSGGNAGKMYIQMKNGNKFEVSFFAGEISGLIYGKRKYAVCSKAFVLERNHQLVAEISANKESKGLYEWKELGIEPTIGHIIGGIFKVKQKFLDENPSEKTLMYSSGLKKSDVLEKLGTISGIWFSKIFIGTNQINENKTALPVEYANELLPSDSNFRMDVLMHRIGDLARSQEFKEELEKIQRRDKKGREKEVVKKE